MEAASTPTRHVATALAEATNGLYACPGCLVPFERSLKLLCSHLCEKSKAQGLLAASTDV